MFYQGCVSTFILLIVTATAADKQMEETSKTNKFQVVNSQLLEKYVKLFNADDAYKFPNTKIKNEDALEFLEDNIPLFECPDEDFQRNWYFRWWTYRKHVKMTPDGYVVTEFAPNVGWAMKYNAINCPSGHHIREGRWLANSKIVNDYTRFWLIGGGDTDGYSTWLADSFLALQKVHFNKVEFDEVLPNLVLNFERWEKARLQENGLFWQYADRDGMEIPVGGNGQRPTINSYMYGNAVAIGVIARMAGKNDIAERFEARAKQIKNNVQDMLWDSDAKFFKVRKHDGKLVDVREQLGFIPWYFNLPEKGKGYEVAWKQLMDPQGFYAPFGPTTAEQRHPGFKVAYTGHGCQWNGPSWPFATSQTLTALASVLNNYEQDSVSKEDYFKTLGIYTRSHRKREGFYFKRDDFKNKEGASDVTFDPGPSWIDENLDPYTGDWIARTRLTIMGNSGSKGRERGKDYNHSSYNDLIITGLVGLRPRLDNIVEVNPLLPENTWDYFCLDKLRYHDRILTIIWDKTGEKYGKGKGLSVYANGLKIAEAPTLTKVTGTLDGIAVIPYVQRAPIAADKSANLKVLAVRASHTNTSDTTSGLIQNSIPYGSGDQSIKRWTSWPQTGKSQWVELDLGDKASVKSLGVFWFQDAAGVKVPASWHVEASDDKDGPWVKVPPTGGKFGVKLDVYNTVQFGGTLKSRYVRIVMTPTKGKALGILSIIIKKQK